jgi:hypothetical protein
VQPPVCWKKQHFAVQLGNTQFDNLRRQALTATRHQNDDLPSDINFECRHTHEVACVNKRAGEDPPERVNAAMKYRIELIAGAISWLSISRLIG